MTTEGGNETVGYNGETRNLCAYGHMYCDGGEMCSKRRYNAAFELDMALQQIKRLERGERAEWEQPCHGMDGSLPCSKPNGHDGPHYFYRP